MFLVARPGAPNVASLPLVAMPGAPSSDALHLFMRWWMVSINTTSSGMALSTHPQDERMGILRAHHPPESRSGGGFDPRIRTDPLVHCFFRLQRPSTLRPQKPTPFDPPASRTSDPSPPPRSEAKPSQRAEVILGRPNYIDAPKPFDDPGGARCPGDASDASDA